MQAFEYMVIPAPTRGTKAKGFKTTQDRFALSLTEAINEMASEGWDYVRAETLPCDERKGLTGTQTTFQNMLVFRRRLRQDTDVVAPLTLGETTSDVILPTRREPTLARAAAEPSDEI